MTHVKNYNPLPESLYLNFINQHFNQPLVNIPDFIICITVGKNFNQDFSTIPETVKQLNICSEYKFPYSTIPDWIEIISINLVYINFPINNLPFSVQEIKINNIFNENNIKEKLHYFKLPFGCKIIANNEDFL